MVAFLGLKNPSSPYGAFFLRHPVKLGKDFVFIIQVVKSSSEKGFRSKPKLKVFSKLQKHCWFSELMLAGVEGGRKRWQREIHHCGAKLEIKLV